MDQGSSALTTTRSSPSADGSRQGTWKWDRAFSAVRACSGCGAEMRPWIGKSGKVQAEVDFMGRRYCTASCSKKHENSMFDTATRLKVANTLRRIKHTPRNRGGNGKPATLPVSRLHAALGAGWVIEFPLKTGYSPGATKFPPVYKIDIAHPGKRIAIEVDGRSHAGPIGRLRDAPKEEFLARSGWSLFRVKNADALRLSTISGSQDILRILRGEC